jgi:Calx-beta domain
VAIGDFNGDGKSDPAVADLRSNNVSILLGTGTVPMNFTMTLSAISGQTVTVAYATADGTATAPSDYRGREGALTLVPRSSSEFLGDDVMRREIKRTTNRRHQDRLFLGSHQDRTQSKPERGRVSAGPDRR